MPSSLILFLLIASLVFPPRASAGRDDETKNAFSYTVNTLVFADARHPSHSTQNPDNAFLDLYRYAGELDLRPDFFWEQPALNAVFKPRFTLSHQWWENGAPKGTSDSSNRTFVNEWRVQVKTFPTLFLSFGKEKLLWGPAFVASPSNILFRDTEKINPKTEVEGKYLAKAVYVPNTTLTVNLMTQTQNDESGLGETLKPMRVLKTDIMGGNYLLSIIGYHRQNDRFRLGSYGQWTASDALLLYYDGIVTRGTDALYPAPDPLSPLGGSFSKKYDGSGRLFTTATAGGAYTFLSGSTLSVEYLYNEPGYNGANAAEYYRLRQNASDHFFDAGPLSGLSTMTLAESLNTGLSFLRKHYLMGQYQVREIKNVLDVIIRYTHSLDEHAGQASSIIEWQVSNRIQFFNINTIAVDHGRDTEFNSILDNSFMAGIEIHL